MNILENAQYVQEEETDMNISITVTIDGQLTSVPIDPANTHYAEILKQVAAGDLTIAEAD
jgi:hypothetical protein